MISLGDLETAIFEALVRVNPGGDVSGGGTNTTAREPRVRYIGRWLGEPVRSSQISDYYRGSILKEMENRHPAILLGFDGEVADPASNAIETMSGAVETVGLSTWTVLCGARDARGTRLLMHGSAAGADATLGLYDLEQLVEEAITNLGVSGLYRSSNLRFAGSRPYIIAPNELYVLAMKFQARRVLADARNGLDPNYDIHPGYEALTADMNLYPYELSGDVADGPLGSIRDLPGVAYGDPPRPPVRLLTTWFRADFANGQRATSEAVELPSELSPVPMWADFAARRFPLAQPDTDAQPTRQDSGGRPWVRYQLGDTHYGDNRWVPVLAKPRALAVVLRDVGVTGAVQHIAGWGATAATALSSFDLVVTAAGTLGVSTGAAVIDTGYTMTVPGNHLVLADYDGTAVAVRVVPPSGVGITVAAPAALVTADERQFRVGRGGTLVAAVADVLVWRDALTGDEETELLTWAAEAYGVAGG